MLNTSTPILYKKNKLSAHDYINQFKLQKHIEGGYHSLFYKATNQVIPLNVPCQNMRDQESEIRSSISSIYYLLESGDFSAWHRLKSDELWHYYDGNSPIDIYIIDHVGNLKICTLGTPCDTKNASFQVFVKAGCWFAAEVRKESSFALAGCTVAPGFEYQDFELADRNYLLNQYKDHQDIIRKFTRPDLEIGCNQV